MTLSEKISELRGTLDIEYDTQYKATLDNILKLVEVKTSHAPLIRLMSIPMIYACWEGFFKTATSKCLIIIQERNTCAKDASASQRAAWLKKAAFFQSYVDILRNAIELDADINAQERHSKQKAKVKKGQHTLLADTLEHLDQWHATTLDKTIPVESLILTFSNVNRDVVDLNAKITGLDQMPEYLNIDFSQLEKLVGQRNSIGHGGISSGEIIRYPGHLETSTLLTYTITLIEGYRRAVHQWLDSAVN